MRPDDGPSVQRVDALVDGAAPRDRQERQLLALLAQARAATPPAPEALRARVRHLAADEGGAEASGVTSSFSERLRELPRRLRERRPGRPALAAAAAGLAGVVALAIAVPLLRDGGVAEDGAPASSGLVAPGEGRAIAPGPPADERDRGQEGAEQAAGPPAPGAEPPGPQKGRRQEIRSFTRVQVEDVAALSAASSRAMDQVRGLGGFTQSSQYRVPHGGEGTNTLVFRVPAARAERAVAAFGRLGTVLSQRATLVDLTDSLASGRTAIGRSAAALAELRRRAAAAPTDEDLQRRLARAERRHQVLAAGQRALARRAELATVNLELTTEGPPPGPSGRLGGAIGGSGARLAAVGVVGLAGLILLAPFLAIAAAGAWTVRRVRDRRRSHLMRQA